jgi:hypothetical protein
VDKAHFSGGLAVAAAVHNDFQLFLKHLQGVQARTGLLHDAVVLGHSSHRVDSCPPRAMGSYWISTPLTASMVLNSSMRSSLLVDQGRLRT